METAADRQLKLKQRLKDFAKDAVLACGDLKGSYASRYVASQLIRCSTSVAANYRAACRARSKREFIAKIGLVLEEADETCFWVEFASEINALESERARTILSESSQFVAIFMATLKTAKGLPRKPDT
jgi:four helix bundle protein